MQTPTPTQRSYQAEVYLALATIVQAITLTALGSEVVDAIKTLQAPQIYWVFPTGLLSLFISISFWYSFMRDYFFGFRIIILSPQNHMVLASVIFVMGFLQFIAFHFLEEPRLWLTLVVMTILVMFFNSWYLSRHVRVIEGEEIHRAMTYDAGYTLFLILFGLVLIGLVGWYFVPGIDGPLFRGLILLLTGAALVQFNLSAQKVFKVQLEVEI